MTQYSFFWGCGSTGDQGNVTLEKMRWVNMLVGNAEPEDGGVIYWKNAVVPPAFDSGISFSNPVTGLLKPTNPSGSNVRIASGVGIVGGSFYFNDDNIDFNIASDLGNANATDLIVLEFDSTTSTVRLARVKGAVSTIATVTQNSTLWQVELAKVELDGSGDFSALIDTRKLAHPPVGGLIKIYEDKDVFSPEITVSDIPPFFKDLRIIFSGRRNTAGASPDFCTIDFSPVVAGLGAITTVDYNGTSTVSTVAPSQLDFPEAGSRAGASASYVIDVINYSSPLERQCIFKGALSRDDANTDPASISGSFTIDAGDPIDEIIIAAGFNSGDFFEGSRFAVYGII